MLEEGDIGNLGDMQSVFLKTGVKWAQNKGKLASHIYMHIHLHFSSTIERAGRLRYNISLRINDVFSIKKYEA